jgi:hypothetical protein
VGDSDAEHEVRHLIMGLFWEFWHFERGVGLWEWEWECESAKWKDGLKAVSSIFATVNAVCIAIMHYIFTGSHRHAHAPFKQSFLRLHMNASNM